MTVEGVGQQVVVGSGRVFADFTHSEMFWVLILTSERVDNGKKRKPEWRLFHTSYESADYHVDRDIVYQIRRFSTRSEA